MLASLVLALLAAAPPAEAAAELQLRTNSPIVVIVDGRPANVMSNLKMRATDLTPGSHDVRITGMFGKTLFEGTVDLPDGTVTHAEWENRELRIVRTTPLESEAGEPVAEELPAEELPLPAEELPLAEPEVDDFPVDEALVDEALVDELPLEELPLEEPIAVEPVPEEPFIEELALAVPPDALIAVEQPPLPVGLSRSLSVELREGMAIEVLHGQIAVRLVVEDGALVVDDGEGLRLELK